MIARYTLHKKIGSGSYGVVFRATDESGTEYAIKVRKPTAFLENRSFLDARYLREIEALERFRGHPNIVRLIDYDMISMCMERCANQTWRDMAGKWNETACEKAMTELVSAVQHIHAAGWLHRDVAPPNIFIAMDGTTKLGDFGLARKKERCMTMDVTTLWYRHPKLLQPDPIQEYGEEIDWWSVMCCCLELMTGRVTFRGRDIESQYRLIENALRAEVIEHLEPWMLGWLRDSPILIRTCP